VLYSQASRAISIR